MAGCARVALWCAVLAAVGALAAAYTVDCNHDYTDCDTELSKLSGDDDEQLPQKAPSIVELTTKSSTTTPFIPTIPPYQPTFPSTSKLPEGQIENKTDFEVSSETTIRPKARLLNLNVDELQNFANALHNQTQSNEKSIKKTLDLSDVNLDAEDEDEPPRMMTETKHKETGLPDKFYANLEAPFHSLIINPDRGSEEVDTCKENDIIYKVGEKMERGCDEECECIPGGVFDCTPRCKHPYIRRGRRLNDPLCFESPVDECCSIIACATGTGGKDMKVPKMEVCRYGNDTHQVGTKWHIGCEQTCSCERNSIVTCRPRCKSLIPSDKCINVQDPNDACCEVQVCDVSQDVHEEPVENTTTTTSTTTEALRGFEIFHDPTKATMRPLVLSEPIGSVKVLQNNSVQVNLMHPNKSEDPIHLLLSNDGGRSFKDVELKYSNLILNLEGGKDYILKTKETGTKFNFTMTASDGIADMSLEEIVNNTRVGCYQDGQFYGVGEEFHIGCSELCECTGSGTQECAALVCPSHVGLELVSKGCVRWAPSPPAQPPNCCPRSARCLSDGTCHYKGVAVPNWSEVPISLTGCEQRCFCENGELDCQEVCTPLPPVPPQSLRCPPMHRPSAVNISDDDCCKQWGCLPNAENINGSNTQTSTETKDEYKVNNYMTPIPPMSSVTGPTLPKPPLATESIDFYRHLSPVKSYPNFIKSYKPLPISSPISMFSTEQTNNQAENFTTFTFNEFEFPFKKVQPDSNKNIHKYDNWLQNTGAPDMLVLDDVSAKTTKPPFAAFPQSPHIPHGPTYHYVFPEKRLHNILQPPTTKSFPLGTFNPTSKVLKHSHPIQKIPISEVDTLNYFLPSSLKKQTTVPFPITEVPSSLSTQTYFEPTLINKTSDHSKRIKIVNTVYNSRDDNHAGKHVTILRNNDLKSIKYTGHEDLWNHDPKTHLLTKSPNPYETVLLRALPNAKIDVTPNSNLNLKGPHIAGKTYSALDLEHLLTQMELESEVNRNLGRSADKRKDDAPAVQSATPGFPPAPNSNQIPFLPTIPPDPQYPQEDIPYYDQNNIARPGSTLEPGIHGLPPGFTPPTSYGDENKKLTVISLQADSPTSVKMLFGLPPVLVGLRGSVDLRYTDKADEDISHWYSQVFAPAEEVLTTPRLEFRLTGLKPSTTYKIRGKLYLHNLPVEPESDVYSVRTQDSTSVTQVEEKRREIDSRLTVVDVNDTSALVSWRHFVEDELQFIDGIQIRYRPVGTPIYSMTELLHHSRSAVELHDLRPGSRYEASLVMVPPPRATTELHDPGRVEFTTSPYVDPYNWTVTIEARAVGSEAAELTWRGIPSPAERWVRVYRAAHACVPPGTRREHDSFRLAARDLPPTITLTGLEPNNRCRVWLELFLTNGKVKTSNVLEIKTKSLDSPDPIDNVIEASSIGSRGDPHGDYYGALVVVGVVAALGALTSLLLLLVVVRRHRPRSVPITPVPSAPRESSLPPYDNPAYKLELQQETMDL